MKLSDYMKAVGKPFSYYPEIAKALGSVKATVLLCALVWKDRDFQDGVIQKTEKVIQEETGLGLKEVKSAKKRLSELGILKTVHHRLEHVTDMIVDLDKLDEILTASPEVPDRYFGRVRNGTSGESESAPRSISLELSKRREERIEPVLPLEESKVIPIQRQLSDLAIRQFEGKFGTKPTWTGADYTQLARLLKVRPATTANEFESRYRNFLESGSHFHQEQGGALKFFVTHYDVFINAIKGAGNGFKNKAVEAAEHNAKVFKAASERHQQMAGDLLAELPQPSDRRDAS